MLRLSYVPQGMKRGTVITLFKGGKKLRTDPNNYRAITLSSEFIRLYEHVLLKLIDTVKPLIFNRLQYGFQKNLGCLMTSFSLKECIVSICLKNMAPNYLYVFGCKTSVRGSVA